MRIIIVTFLICCQSLFGQKYFTRTGSTGFKASVAAFEPVQALNKSTSVVLTKEGQIASQLFISAFKFRIALMQEHFNENFMDSDEFPKATFKGEIVDFNLETLMDTKEHLIKGVLTIKGVDKEVEIKVNISKINNIIKIKSEFIALPEDFNIKIPSLIRKKIAREVIIDLNYELVEKK
jgi:hypothetical protein